MIPFLEVVLIGFAIITFTLATVRFIGSSGDGERFKDLRMRVFHGLMALMSIGAIEMWQKVVFL